MTYYGRYYKTALNGLLQRINTYMVRWARRKYKRLRSYKKARKWWDGLTARQPRLFAPLTMGTVITSAWVRPSRFFVWHRRREGRWVDARRRGAHGKR